MRKLRGGGDIYYEYIHTAPVDCPPETGGTRSEATEGVDKTTHYHLLLIHPLPTAWYSPCSRGRKWMLGHCRNIMNVFTPPEDCPPETGGRGAKRRRGWIRPLTVSTFNPTHRYFSLPRRFRKGLDYQRAMSYHAAAGLSLATRDDFAELCVICRSVACDKFC